MINEEPGTGPQSASQGVERWGGRDFDGCDAAGAVLNRARRRRLVGGFRGALERHGPMVMTVCRDVLRDLHDAEDASQATFLVFAQKGGSIRRADSLASWLFGVALRIAAKARAEAARRRASSADKANENSLWQRRYARSSLRGVIRRAAWSAGEVSGTDRPVPPRRIDQRAGGRSARARGADGPASARAGTGAAARPTCPPRHGAGSRPARSWVRRRGAFRSPGWRRLSGRLRDWPRVERLQPSHRRP